MEAFTLINESVHLAAWEKMWPGISAGFSTRNGGTSSGEFDSLNCGLHVGDRVEHVVENRRRLARQNGFSFSSWTCGEQVHGDRIVYIAEEQAGAGRESREDAIPSADGLLTDKRNVFLASFYADCVPLFFYSPRFQVIGVAHAGWKGTVARIGQKMALQMKEQWGIQPEDIYAAIGPSIHSCCYEVNDLVADKIKEVLGEKAQDVLESVRTEKYMLNLQETNRILLLEAGIPHAHIEVSQLCTGCRTDLFFSHRKEGGKTGRMTAFIGLKEG
ncbi:peptidoglycan editing factor PgeF [Aneurinibacillus sp. Ricciae_BoGa-3]|uniref:peptidoglycan editing factor PgeF n=1 Tax=Aneurinibacillus sp. Ricciae_BoGa-3 TaxID=3022697 RepID=UPI002341C010|nr:peptidoglycan editing factor PgeF [Aneurinibacillus sp. Ricciae_BoGa-3]WCK53066.1 peptidoglycan editing factor PgeF [Aneurinibacillus sp. Ricciae_BoGa-3]